MSPESSKGELCHQQGIPSPGRASQETRSRVTPGADVSCQSRMSTSSSEKSEDTTQVPGLFSPGKHGHGEEVEKEVGSEKADRPFYLERMDST